MFSLALHIFSFTSISRIYDSWGLFIQYNILSILFEVKCTFVQYHSVCDFHVK